MLQKLLYHSNQSCRSYNQIFEQPHFYSSRSTTHYEPTLWARADYARGIATFTKASNPYGIIDGESLNGGEHMSKNVPLNLFSKEDQQDYTNALVTTELGKLNPTPIGALPNHAVVAKVGDAFKAEGTLDFLDPNAALINEDTLYRDASIAKSRLAGLAFILQENDVINLQSKAGEFFAQPKVLEYFEKKYPGKGDALQKELGILFSGDGTNATIADLATHRSGVEDFVFNWIATFKKEQKGFLAGGHDIPKLIVIDEDCKVQQRDASGRPYAPLGDPDKAPAHGQFSYSNAGYEILALALEAADFIKNPPKQGQALPDFRQLMKDYMLQPTKGRAFEKKIKSFDRILFPTDIHPEEKNIMKSPHIDPLILDKIGTGDHFGLHPAAGGMYVSVKDSNRFYGEFFRGFPGTKDEGDNKNPFFSDDTIKAIVAEQQKWPKMEDNWLDNPNPTHSQYYGAGYCVQIDEQGNPHQYHHAGKTPGFGSDMHVHLHPQTKEMVVETGCGMNENLTYYVARNQALPHDKTTLHCQLDPKQKEAINAEVKTIMEGYKDGSRNRLELPELLQQRQTPEKSWVEKVAREPHPLAAIAQSVEFKEKKGSLNHVEREGERRACKSVNILE